MPCVLFSGAMYEWCKDRLGPPHFFGVSNEGSFIVMKREAVTFNPLNWVRLGFNKTNINVRKVKDIVYQVYLSKTSMKVFLGEYIRRGDSKPPYRGYEQWEWDELKVNPYSPDCFEEIWNAVK